MFQEAAINTFALKGELRPSSINADSNRITTYLLLEAFFAS